MFLGHVLKKNQKIGFQFRLTALFAVKTVSLVGQFLDAAFPLCLTMLSFLQIRGPADRTALCRELSVFRDFLFRDALYLLTIIWSLGIIPLFQIM